ncbi:MAG TPA: indole-3-glycerol phosphate synthase TrpC [Prolixibacteraceae bacterium]|nr:indole-3-glycerol phosphate synthase TrpC [Prolixibacteraceae bacterium]
MSTILDTITAAKREEVALSKKSVPMEILHSSPMFLRKCNSLKNSILLPGSSGIIAEFKQKSPSKGVINAAADVVVVATGYAAAGASGISVLTDFPFFGGTLDNLMKARLALPEMPLLRKDFMIDEYQLVEAKASGADVVLLIAACLSKLQAAELACKARELGMEVLFEIHGEEELELIPEHADFVGVNNRNLKTMKVSLETSVHLSPLIPDYFLKIAESGILNPEDVIKLKAAGYRGFLIGENFMKTIDPVIACKEFIMKLK